MKHITNNRYRFKIQKLRGLSLLILFFKIQKTLNQKLYHHCRTQNGDLTNDNSSLKERWVVKQNHIQVLQYYYEVVCEKWSKVDLVKQYQSRLKK